jgi:hypothetical protein
VSWAVNTHASGDYAAKALRQQFEELFPEAEDGVKAQFEIAASAVEKFLDNEQDSGVFSLSASGHVGQGEGERSYMAVHVNPVLVHVPPDEQEQEA